MDKTLDPIEFNAYALDDLDKLSEAILEKLSGMKICIVEGSMGAGKTTLIKAICKRLEVNDTVSSPTFSIVNEYFSKDGPVYHFDFYRVESLEEALNAGVEEYFFSGNLCFIEWPEIITDILPAEYLKIQIIFGEDQNRIYKLISHGAN